MVLHKKNYYDSFLSFLFSNDIKHWHLHDGWVVMQEDEKGKLNKNQISVNWVPSHRFSHSNLPISTGDKVAIIKETPGKENLKPFEMWIYQVAGFTRDNFSNYINMTLIDIKEVVFEKTNYLIIGELMQKHVAENATEKPRKWYSAHKFPLVPVLRTKKADYQNTANFTFEWLFLRLWSLDSFSFEIALNVSEHWGFGLTAIVPYLRIVFCIPIPEKIGSWIHRNLSRKPQIIKKECQK